MKVQSSPYGKLYKGKPLPPIAGARVLIARLFGVPIEKIKEIKEVNNGRDKSSR